MDLATNRVERPVRQFVTPFGDEGTDQIVVLRGHARRS
jgi:hypothetical protein